MLYAIFCYNDEDVIFSWSKEQDDAVMAKLDVVHQKLARNGKLGPAVVDPGNPFSGAVNKIKSDGSTSKGPIGQRASGYTILEASSLDSATKMGKGCPILKSGGQVAVYETFDVM